ncbi:hypothetical protein LJR034_004083 [Caballeronia sp. LjRoot34]|uniref:hypothetical protein n=1 Tax=Caballeronia sp. LjRoot34 TaxID=3342325 RepID=UPI003ECDEFF3
MAVEASQASWFGIVASSAVISALVNVVSNWRLKVGDRKREDKREQRRVGHVYLEIAQQLEAFAKRCDTYIDDIDEQLDLFYQRDDNAFQNLNKPFTFAFHPEPKWEELPIPFTSKVKALSQGFAETSGFIHRAWEWSDEHETWALETQRVAFHGLRAIEIAVEVRKEIGAGHSVSDRQQQLDAAAVHFIKEINNCRENFKAARHNLQLIPELKAQFTAEFPSPDDPPEIDLTGVP